MMKMYDVTQLTECCITFRYVSGKRYKVSKVADNINIQIHEERDHISFKLLQKRLQSFHGSQHSSSFPPVMLPE
jgi:hypothetical protein